ncbi:MAG: hypothetical protein K6T74_17270, partial [Geminicoccaceae bacterium]|nr:hypothetical protein [Geminicoccaceae bacterium]
PDEAPVMMATGVMRDQKPDKNMSAAFQVAAAGCCTGVATLSSFAEPMAENPASCSGRPVRVGRL